jgi:hypothetical protein
MRQVSAVSAVSAVIPSTRSWGRRGAILPEPITVTDVLAELGLIATDDDRAATP